MRFPGFTDEWKKTTLGEITTNFNLRNKEQIDYPMFSVTNNRGFIPQSEQFEDREMKGEDIKAYKVIHHNEFAYNPARINVGSIAKYNGYEPCMISSLYVCFKANNEVDEDWLMHLLRTPKIQYYYQLNGEGGVRIYLFYPNFARIRTSIPSIEEQKKIAKILSIIDERIATQNKIINNLQSLIKGLRERFFKGRYPSYILLGEIAQLYQPKTIATSELEETGYLVYGANGVIGHYHSYNHVNPQICITCRGNTCGQVTLTVPYSWITGNAMVVNIDTNKDIDQSYLFHFLSSYNFNSIISGSGQPQIVRSPLAKIHVPDMEINEQRKISRVLDSVISKIDSEQNMLRLFQLQKNYLVNLMFI